MKKFVFLILILVAAFVAYEALMFYDNNFSYGRMRETPAVKPYEHPLLIMEPGTVPFEGGEALYRAATPESLVSSVPLDDAEVIGRGAKQYFTYCQQCHGLQHDGNGTVGQSFAPLPTDLRSGRIQQQSSGYLFQHISYGIGGTGRQPALATTVSIDKRWEIIAYIKSLGTRK